MATEHNSNLEKQLIQKQMGCMAGFLQIFDRHHILTGKRIYSTKRLTTTSEWEKSAPPSTAFSTELRSPPPPPPPKSPIAPPAFESKEGTKSSWKFRKEAPRLSLDSRDTTDAKGGLHPKQIPAPVSILSVANRCDGIATDTTTDGGGQHLHNRSPSVIARLIGLEPPPNSNSEPEKKPVLRRSASESRVSRDLFSSRFVTDAINVTQSRSHSAMFNNGVKDNSNFDAHYAYPSKHSSNRGNKAEPPKGLNRGGSSSSSPWRATHHRKSFFDSVDVFPEPKQSASIYREIEKRLRMRVIDEPSQDLETLKQILEGLQLKGLLHSKQPPQQNQIRHRSLVYNESPIVVMKPLRSPNSTPINRRLGNDGRNQIRGVRRNYSLVGEHSPSVSPLRERKVQSPTRSGRSSSPTKRSNSVVKHKPSNVEAQRRVNKSTENRSRVSPVHSPKLNITAQDRTVNNRSPRNKKPTAGIHQKEKITTIVAVEDESSSISGSSINTSTDTERWKTEEYKDGRNLLERCDKLLLHSMEIGVSDTQPSPVSVLDSSFYKEDSSTPSPVTTTRRNIDFKGLSIEFEDGTWSPMISPIRSKRLEIIDDCDFAYISDILRVSDSLTEDSNLFLLLEKQQYLKGNDTSKVSRLQRKLIFDTINEILERNKRLSSWKAVSWDPYGVETPSLTKVWFEFQKIRERENAEDLFEIICGVLKRDLADDAINGWGDSITEMSEAVLEIERLLFKDLIGDAVRDLTELASRSMFSSMIPRRKLVF